MKQEISIKNIGDIDRAAAKFIERIGDRKLVAFFAPMGAGKTTFTTAICRVLGVTDPVGSPTFAIINEYMKADGEPMYHFDFYRINSINEAFDMGYEEYFYSGDLCLVEWPEKVEPLLPDDTMVVKIEIIDENTRRFTIE